MNTTPPAERFDGYHLQSERDGVYDESFSLPPVIIQYWQAVVRWRLIIAGIIAAAIAAGVLITLLQAPLFTAHTQIEISRTQKNVTNVQGLEGAASQYDTEFYDTQYALLKAESLADRLVRELKLADDTTFFAAHGIDLPDASGTGNALPKQEHKARAERAAGLLLDNVEIAPVRNSRLVAISYTSRIPAISAKIANAWPQAFIAASMDQQFASTADARRFLEERLGTLRTKLEQSERNVVNFASQRDIVTLGATRDASGRTMEPRTLAVSDLEALNAALIEARTERIAAESRSRTATAASSAEALASSTIKELRQRRAEVAAEYARLLVQFEPGYPAARALKEQMASLDTAIADETARISGSRRLTFEEARKREAELANAVETLKTRVDQQQRDTIQYNIYQREADTNRQLYDALLQRYKEIGIAGTVGATNIVLVDTAKLPTIPSAPSLPKNLAIALLLGLVVAAGVVFALEQIDEGIRNPRDVEQLLKLPLIGNVPRSDGEPAKDLIDPKSELSEAYFSVRAALALATTHGLPRSLAVTSTQPGEGKSISALALATIIGRTGKRVLLVDADMRSPSVHKLVGGDNSKGLSTLLAGDNSYSNIVRTTEMKGLSVLPAGPNPPSAAELLSTERLDEVLASLQSAYDCIVIDAPPVIGLADAPLIGRAVEGCIFVIEAEGAAVRAIRSALERLQVGHTHVYGAIVTKIDTSRHNYGYGYGQGYNYSYQYGKS